MSESTPPMTSDSPESTQVEMAALANTPEGKLLTQVVRESSLLDEPHCRMCHMLTAKRIMQVSQEAMRRWSDRNNSALRLRVEELTNERDQLRAGMTPEAHARVGETVDRLLEVINQWRIRAEKAERELGEARQARKIELEQETDGRWLAEYKGIPGMMVYGATIREALRKLADLIRRD